MVDDVYAGIDLSTGYFHVESENIEAMDKIYDALFVFRGLNAEDFDNYVIVGQYLELLDR